MWQPNRSQWLIICAIAALLVLCWPPDRGNGSSLMVKAIHRAVDPTGSLPPLPPPLPPGLGDNGDAVAAHDAIEAEYFRLHNRDAWTRWRMDVKAAGDPIDPATERQILIATAVAGLLAVWGLAGSAGSSRSSGSSGSGSSGSGSTGSGSSGSR